MSHLGFVDYKKYKGIKLTEFGRNQGLILMRKHRILEFFFKNFLGLSKKEACIEASKIDLYISENKTCVSK